jgi:hypothetical protein
MKKNDLLNKLTLINGMDLVFVSTIRRTKLRVEIMKKLLVLLLFATVSTYAHAYISGIAIQTDRTSNMQVYVNGKLYNKVPGKFVRIKSKPGLFHIEVKVLNPYDKNWYLVRKDINVEKGFEFYYKMVFAKGQKPQIQEVRKYPVYTKYFLNPMLYNKHPVS